MKKNLSTDVVIESVPKRFSIKRGISFFGIGNLFLIFIVLLILFNWSRWFNEGIIYFVIFILLSEVMILILSFIACLKPRVYKD